jgi:hypothetical protein
VNNNQVVTPYEALWGIDIIVDNRLADRTILLHPKRRNTLRCNARTLHRLKLAVDMSSARDVGLYLRKYYEFKVENIGVNFVGLATV